MIYRLCRTVSIVAALYAIHPGAAFAASRPLSLNSSDGKVLVYQYSKALIIAESKYRRDTGWIKLTGVPQETKRIADTLAAQGFDTEIVPDANAATVQAKIKTFLAANNDHDTRLLIYYAGHGATVDGTGYLVPVDAPDPDAPDYMAKIVSTEDIRNWSMNAHAKHILFIFDSCFSGAVFLTRANLKPSNDLFLADAMRTTREFITSGSENEEVGADSYFAGKVVEGLNGAADIYPDGVVTAAELGYWLKNVVSAQGRQTPQYGAAPSNKYVSGDVLFVPNTVEKVFSKFAPSDVHLNSAVLSGSGHWQFAGGKKGNFAKYETFIKPTGAALRVVATRSIGIPDKESEKAFTGYDVVYFRKVDDGNRINKILGKSGIPYSSTFALIKAGWYTNAIGCHKDTPVDLVKRVANTLIDGGIKLQAVKQFEQPAGKSNRIEILSILPGARHPVPENAAPLTRTQIASLTRCPVFLRN
jgi:caspase domain-containing protein